MTPTCHTPRASISRDYAVRLCINYMSVTRMRASVSVHGTRRVSTVMRLVGMLWCSPARRWTPYRTQGLDFRATLRKRRQRARVAASDETAEGARKAEKRFTRARHMSAHSAYT